ncbi:MAG: hypothetical protein ACREBU_12450, partial [Nitrososphaera sp.]
MQDTADLRRVVTSSPALAECKIHFTDLSPAIRAALGSVKRFVTAAGNVRFDAERTDLSGHADH